MMGNVGRVCHGREKKINKGISGVSSSVFTLLRGNRGSRIFSWLNFLGLEPFCKSDISRRDTKNIRTEHRTKQAKGNENGNRNASGSGKQRFYNEGVLRISISILSRQGCVP